MLFSCSTISAIITSDMSLSRNTITNFEFSTPGPILSIMPQNSCPIINGVLIVLFAQLSHLYICKSVPHIDVSYFYPNII